MLVSRRLGSDPQLRRAEQNQPPLATGSTGSGVAIMQDLLADLGFPLPRTLSKGKADGIFGIETRTAVRSFQQSRGLKVDGIAGTLTLRSLDAEVLRNQRLEDKDGRKDLDRGYW